MKKSKEQISYNMSRVKAKGSTIEKILASGLRKRRIKYRGHVKSVYGCPDFVLPNHRVAIFCDSHFWHGYRWKKKKNELKSNKDFWFSKIENNIKRDKSVNRKLRLEGWSVLRFWEHKILKDLDKCLNKIESVI